MSPPPEVVVDEVVLVVVVVVVEDDAEVVALVSSLPQPTERASEVTPARTKEPKIFVFMCSASVERYHSEAVQRNRMWL
jgi:hypothetical protein